MFKNGKRLIYLLATFFISTSTFAQSVDVFGFFQSVGTSLSINQDVFSPLAMGKVSINQKSTNLYMQQANLFATSELGSGFSAFVNLEFTNNYSSNKFWGSFNLQEAYVKYQKNSALRLKVGLFLPKFNNLNEVYNRTPLLPYINRPLIYETSFWVVISPEDFLPQRGFFQVYGALRMGKARFDYSAFVGSSEDSFVANENPSSPNNPQNSSYPISGWEYSKSKTFGGRIGLRYSGLKLGVSATYDKDNLNKFNVSLDETNPVYASLGEVPRIRFGADLEYSLKGLFLNAEYESVNYNMKDGQDVLLKTLASPQIPGISNSSSIGGGLDKEFYYVTLGYNYFDNYFVYCNYGYLADDFNNLINSDNGGLKSYMIGGGYKPMDLVTLKLQYMKMKFNSDLADLDQDIYSVAVSVSF